MALPIILSIAFFALVALLLASLNVILLPFIVSALLGYLLDPLADKLEAKGMARGLASAITLAGFVLVFLSIILLLVPLLHEQIQQLLQQLPTLFEKTQTLVLRGQDFLQDRFSVHLGALQLDWRQYGEEIASTSFALLKKIIASGSAAFHLGSLLFITPVVSFYFLRDWDKMIAAIMKLIPRHLRRDAHTLTHDMDRSIAGYLRGQTLICLCFAVYYALCFSLIGLKYGLLLGLISGLLAFIPYVGLLIAMSLTLLIAYSGSGDLMVVALCVGTFIAAQLLESAILQPKIMGEATGLHPVWIIFGLMAWGLWLGFTGILIAVPATAAMGAIIRFFVDKYRQTDFYLGKAT